MAYVIDETYFIRELVIPTTTEVDVSNTANPFSNWIDTEARRMLEGALGFTLFTDFDNNVTAGVYQPGVTKWDNLVTGVTYTFEGNSYRFQGLTFTDGSVPRSMMAYYVWSKWFTFFVEQVTGMGPRVGAAANSFVSKGSAMQAKNWNSFENLYNGDVGIWQIVSGISFDSEVQNTRFVSLLKFLLHNEDDYPDAALIVHRLKNMFSI